MQTDPPCLFCIARLESCKPKRVDHGLAFDPWASAERVMQAKLFGPAVFAAAQVALMPASIAGYFLVVGKGIAAGRRTGASQTALASFYTRWMQDQLKTRIDPQVERLMPVLPNISPLGLRFVSAGSRLTRALTGYVPRTYRYPFEGQPAIWEQNAARTTYYDEVLEKRADEVEQFVVLGAGLDTRCFRLPSDSKVRCFLVDAPKTQAYAREQYAKAGLDVSHVTFVSADFEREDWFEKLQAAGFDKGKKSLFFWESVAMYLTTEAVVSTLSRIASTAPGSVLAFDYFASDVLTSPEFYKRYARWAVRVVGEPFGTFGIDNTPPVRAQVEKFLEPLGFVLEDQKNFGVEDDTHRAAAGFAVARVAPR
jgi:methyltransferase (TIGR00027 family)